MMKSLRLQLTAWYLLFFTALFLGFSIFIYEILSRSLRGRLDESLSAEINTAAGLFRGELTELGGDAFAAARETMQEMSNSGRLLAVFEGDQLLAANGTVKNPALLARAVPANLAADAVVRATLHDAKHGSRAAARGVEFHGRRYRLIAAESLRSIHADLALVRRVLYLALPPMLLIAGIGGYLLASKSLAPLRSMAGQARRITDKNLHTRLEIGKAHEELQVLSDSFNELLSRLDQSFETMRRFVADASHELRTPVAVIRGETDVALSKASRQPGEYRESLAVIQDEARRLSRLIEDLLNLARADSGHVNVHTEEFYLNDLLAETCRSMQAAAAAKNVEIQCRCPEDAPFRGDQELIRRLALNLLDNAIRYTPEGGKVSVRLDSSGGAMRIQVADTGAGIPPDKAPHIFERFYRGDEARSRQDGGFGLGLSIVKWIAESHNGSVELASRLGSGSTFTVLLRS